MNEGQTVREQHFYREGNAEVLRLVTRGQVDDTAATHHRQAPTLIVDGKDIILKRFIEDQKSRHELSMKDFEIARSMESHQRSKDICQQQAPEIILIPERLDLGHRKHIDDLGPNVQRLVIDHGDYGSQKIESKDSQIKEAQKQEREENIPAASMSERPSVIVKEHLQAANAPSYSFHDLELARQNALLTRLLLERENRQINVGVMDATSYLETQSLPGQVAIATQTDRTTATQTERQVRSRSDNDESDDDARYRKKKWKKKYSGGDWKKTRTLWMKSPIEEEGSPCFDKRLSILRKKVREVKEGRKISLEPNVLREISDSLDGNGSSYKGEEDGSTQTYKKSTEQTSIRYKILNEEENGSASSTETCKDNYEKVFGEKTNVMNDDKIDATESTSSPERKIEREMYARGKKDDKKTPRKETKVKKKSDGKAKPSFRILEREITMLTKKLSKLGNKKVHDSTGSDSTSQVRSKSLSRDSKKDSDQRNSKKPETSSVREQKQSTGYVTNAPKSEQTVSQRKDAVIAKTKHKLKYQQTQVMSTGSSEYDDTFEKPKKQISGMIQDAVKQKQLGQSQVKIKRQAHVDRRELKKQKVVQSEEKDESQNDGVSMEDSNLGLKFEKSEKLPHAPKLADISRVGKVVEEFSTSESSNEMEGKRGTFALVGSSERNNRQSSENDSNHHRRLSSVKNVVEKDNYSVAESKKEDANREMVSQEETMDVKEEEEVGRIDTRSDGERRSIKSEVEDPDTTIEKPDGGEHGVLKGFLKQTIDLRDISKQLVSDDLDSFASEKEKDDLATSSFDKAKKNDEKESTEVTTVIEKEETREEVGTSPPADSKSIIEKYSTDEFIDQHDKQLNEITGKIKEVIEDKFEQDAKEDKLLEDTEKDMKKAAEMEFLKGKGLKRGMEETLQELGKEQVFSDIEKDIKSKLAEVKADSDKEIRIDSAKGSADSSAKGSVKGSGKGSVKGSAKDSDKDSDKGSYKGSDKDSDKGSAKDSVKGSVKGSIKGSTKSSPKDSPKANAKEELSIEFQEQEFEDSPERKKSGDIQTAEELTMKFIERELPSEYKKFTEHLMADGTTEYEKKDEEGKITEYKDDNVEIQVSPDTADISPETKGFVESFETKDDYFKKHEEARESSDSNKPAEIDIYPEISKSDDHIVSIEDTLSETKEFGIESKQQDAFLNVNIPDKHHMITEVTTPERPGDDSQYEKKDISSGTMKPDEHYTKGTSMPREITKANIYDISSDDGASIIKKDDSSVNVERVSAEGLNVDDYFDNRKDISIEADKTEDYRKSAKSISPEITETDDHRIDSKETSPKVTEHDDHGTSTSDILIEKMKAEDHRIKKDSSEFIKSDDHYDSATDSSWVKSQVDDHHADEKDISTKILKIDSRDSSTEDVPAKIIVPDEPLSTQPPKIDNYSPNKKDTTSEISEEDDHELSTKHVPSEITDSDKPSSSQKDIFLEATEADEHYVGTKDISPEIPKTGEQNILSKDITLKVPETDELYIGTEDISPESKTSDQYVSSEQISQKIPETGDYCIGAKDVSQKVPDTDKHHVETVDDPSHAKELEDYCIGTKEISSDLSKIHEHSIASTDIPPEEKPDLKDCPPKTLETGERLVGMEKVSQEASKSKSDSASPKDGSPQIIKADEHRIEKDIPPEIDKPGDDEISTKDISSKVPQDDGHRSPKEEISPKVSEITDADCTEQHFVSKVLKPDEYNILQETSSTILKDEVHKIIAKDVSPKCVSNDINKDVSPDILKTGDHSTAEDSAPLETLKSIDSFPEISKDDDKHITKTDVFLDTTKFDDQGGKTESILSETVNPDELTRKKDISVESEETKDHATKPEIISSKLSKPETYLVTKQDSSSEKSRMDEDINSDKDDGSGKSTVDDFKDPISKGDEGLLIQSPELESSSENIPTNIQQHSDDENLKESPILQTKGKDDDQNGTSKPQTKLHLEIPGETLKRLSEEMIMMEKLKEEEDKKFHTSSIDTVAFQNLNKSSNGKIAKTKESDTQENKLPVEFLDGKLKSTNEEDKEPKVSEESSGDKIRATTETEQITGEPSNISSDKKRILVGEIPEHHKLEELSEDKTTIPELTKASSTDSKDPHMKATVDDPQETKRFEETISAAIEIPITRKQEIDPSTSEISTDLKTVSEPKEHREITDKIIDDKNVSKPKEHLETDEKLIQSTESQQSIVDEPLMAKRDESEPIKSDIESKYIKFPQDELNERDVVHEMIEDEKTEEKADETKVSVDNSMKEEDKEKILGAEHLNVSLPLFGNIIDTGEDSDESDSSSDISRKTTLTRPYQTPRHHRASSVNKTVEMEGKNKPQNTDSDEESTLTIELVEDKHLDSSKDEKVDKKTEDIDAREFPAVTLVHTVADESSVELNKGAKVLSDVEIPIVHERTTENVFEPVNETKSTVLKPDIKRLEPPSTSVERSEDLTSLESAAALKPHDLPSTSKKDLKESKLELKSDEGLSTTANVSKDVKTVKKKSTSKPDDQTSASEKHLGNSKSYAGTKQINETNGDKIKSQSSLEDSKTGSQKIHERKTKQAEKVKPLPRKKKKGSAEEKIDEKPTTQDSSHASRHRRPKQLASDQTAQKDNEATKQKKSIDDQRRRQSLPKSKSEKEKKSGSSDEKFLSPPKTGEIDTSKTQSKYMAWYKKKREEMEKRRAELKTTDDEEHLPKWLRRSMKKSDKEEKMKSSQKTAEMTPRTRRKVKPLINVESEQLKAIVRQGRKLRKAEGGSNEDPPVQIFASTPPATTTAETKHHLVQHSEYKYEKVPPPFYLHPPPAPHPSPQLSPEHFEARARMECEHLEEHPDPSIGVTLQGGNRLRHQQLLEKKSVFDIAYSEAAPSQLRADSTTPPS